MTALVSGATGTTGSEVIRQLRGRGIPVRAMTRRPDAAERLRAGGVEAVVADLADPGSLTDAVDGVETVYIANNASLELPHLEATLARAAARAGAKLLVKLSVIGATTESPITLGRLQHESEQRIRETGIPFAFVRPNGFMQNTLAWAEQIPSGKIRGPVVDARWSIVDVRDVAAVAVAGLTEPERYAGETFTVTGPEASSPRDQVEILAEQLDRPLELEEVSIEQAQQAMLGAGWPRQAVGWMGELFRLYAEGLAEGASSDVERVTGRPPLDYRQFARDHREAFLRQ